MLWHACAGPLVCLPQVGSLVYYFSQGHSEQVCNFFCVSLRKKALYQGLTLLFTTLNKVAVSTRRSATTQVPNYPNLPSQLMCQVHNVTLHVCLPKFFSFANSLNLCWQWFCFVFIGRQGQWWNLRSDESTTCSLRKFKFLQLLTFYKQIAKVNWVFKWFVQSGERCVTCTRLRTIKRKQAPIWVFLQNSYR